MTDRWWSALMVGAFGIALVLLLHVAGCGDGDRAPGSDAGLQDAPAAFEDVLDTTDVGGGSDGTGTIDGSSPSDAKPPPDASLPDDALAD